MAATEMALARGPAAVAAREVNCRCYILREFGLLGAGAASRVLETGGDRERRSGQSTHYSGAVLIPLPWVRPADSSCATSGHDRVDVDKSDGEHPVIDALVRIAPDTTRRLRETGMIRGIGCRSEGVRTGSRLR